MPDLETLFSPLRDASVAPEPMEHLHQRARRLRRRRRTISGGLLLGITGLVVALAATAGGGRTGQINVAGRGDATSAMTAGTPVPRSTGGNHPGGKPSAHGAPGLLVQGANGTVRAQTGSSCWQKGTTAVCVDAVLPAGRETSTLNVHRGEKVALRFDGSNVPESIQASDYEGNHKLRVEPGQPAHLQATLSAGVHDVIVHARFRQGSVTWYIRLRIR